MDPLLTFNRLMPKDFGSKRVAAGLAYGDHVRQRLDLYGPRRRRGSRPVVIFLYGGGWRSGRREGYGFAGRALAARGFVVAVPDHRLVPEIRYPDFLADCAAAVRWVRRHATEHGGDPDRLVVVGHSAGGYNAAMLALDRQWLGEHWTALRGFATLAGAFDFLPLSDPAAIAAFGHWPELERTQPVRLVAEARPALLLHGAADRRVRPRHSEALARRLGEAGGEARLKLYPGIGHVGIVTALAAPFRMRAPVLDDVARFVDEVCRDPAGSARAACRDTVPSGQTQKGRPKAAFWHWLRG